MLYDPASPNAPWKVVLPEKADSLDNVESLGGKLFATYLKDVASHVYVYRQSGQLENEIELPCAGAATGLRGNRGDKDALFLYTSFNYPPSVILDDLAARCASP